MSYKSNMKTRIMVWVLCIAMVFTTVNLPVLAIEANAEEINEETYIGSEETNAESDAVEEDSSYEDASEEMADEAVTDEVEDANDEIGDVTNDADEAAAEEASDETAEEITGEDFEAVTEEIIEDEICGLPGSVAGYDLPIGYDYDTEELIIASASQFMWYAIYVTYTDSKAKARLQKDIVLPDTADFDNLMIGTKDKPFAGSFDGCGHSISNFRISSMINDSDDNCSYAGLFAYAEGTNASHAVIKNLVVYGKIELTKNSAGVSSEENYVGGIVGTAYAYTDIDNVESHISITANMGTKAHIGGIVGSTEWNDNPGGTPINISKCSFSGQITTNCTNAVGGIIGYIQKGTISDCINTASIYSSSNLGNVSGILGYVNNNSSGSFSMKNCVSAGSVSGGKNTAAFVCYKNCPSSMFSSLYYDNTTITKSAYVRLEGGSNISSSDIKARSTDEMSSGAVTWALNGSKSSGDLVWYQRLGENGDPYPSLRKAGDGSNTVYYSYADCEAEEKTYNNNVGVSTKQDGHSSWSNGVCGICGYKCVHDSWSNGVCRTCGYACTHSSWTNGKCETCGYACTHESITGDTCDICGLSGIISVSYTYPLYNADDEPTSGISEWKNGTQNCRIITATDTTLGKDGQTTWYVVNSSDLTIDSTITVNGNVNIILADGAKLTVNGSILNAEINVSGTGNSLTIYGQTAGSGKLITIGRGAEAGIGGGFGGSGSNITINGGEVTATGNVGGAGIGGGANGGSGSNITINGGKVTATGNGGGAGIGGGANRGSGSGITINGGEVTATGNVGGAGIGGGANGGSGSNITINGGEVTATGGRGGAGIGGGQGGSGGNITINGGTIEATGGDGANGLEGSNKYIDETLCIYRGSDRASAGAIENLSNFYAHKYKYVYVGSIVAIYEGCSLSLSGDIGIDIYIKLNKATAENSNTKLNVWNGDKLTEIAVPSNTTNVEGSEYYVFHYSIPAGDYNNELKARVVCGDASGFIFTIRVADYIDYIQANESGKYDEATVNLVNAMEKYCEEAASYFAGNIEAAQYDFAAIAGELGSYKVNASDMGEGYLGTSLILNGKVTLRFYYSDKTVFEAMGIAETDYKQVGNIYYYDITDIYPNNYDVPKFKGYSVYSYILSGLSSDRCSDTLKNLLCAMYEFGQAAELLGR